LLTRVWLPIHKDGHLAQPGGHRNRFGAIYGQTLT
jgi:hypothetical protein